MNRPRWFVCVDGLLLAMVVAGAVIYWLSDTGPIRFENVEKIQVGMTQSEVIALLGCDKGMYATVPVIYLKEPGPDGSLAWFDLPTQDEQLIAGFRLREGSESWFWVGDRGAVVVTFDPAKKVMQKNMARGRRSLPSAWWQAIERRLGVDS